MLQLCLFGCRLYFGIWFFAQLVCCFWLFGRAGAPLFLLSAGHELAHAAAAAVQGQQITALFFLAGEVRMQTKGQCSAAARRRISAAGPLFNVIAAAVLWAVKARQAAAVSWFLAAFNLLPVGETDGEVLTEHLPPRFGKLLRGALTLVLCLLLAGFLLHAGRTTLLAAGLFLLFSFLQQLETT